MQTWMQRQQRTLTFRRMRRERRVTSPDSATLRLLATQRRTVRGTAWIRSHFLQQQGFLQQ